MLNHAGYDLLALGRLEDAVIPLRARVKADMAAKDDRNAAIASGNLIQLLVTIGELSGEAGAAAAGEAAVAFANSSRDDAQRVFERAAHSDALRQLGVLAHAEVLLREAEAIQKQGQPPLPRLYSLQGFQYCNLLFVRGYGAEVSARVSQVQDSWSKMPWWRSTLLDDALYELANARAMLAAVSLAALHRKIALPPLSKRSPPYAAPMMRRIYRAASSPMRKRGGAAAMQTPPPDISARQRTSPRAAPCRCS